jgi:predicted GNAT family acetyltransferase
MPRAPPTCKRCQNHGVTVLNKGHKRYCPNGSCKCPKCNLTVESQRVGREQIALKRLQKLEERRGEKTVEKVPQPVEEVPQPVGEVFIMQEVKVEEISVSNYELNVRMSNEELLQQPQCSTSNTVIDNDTNNGETNVRLFVYIHLKMHSKKKLTREISLHLY